MRNLFLGLAASVLLLVSGPAHSADDDHRLDDAWKAAVEDHEGILKPPQVSGLNVLAYESAVARLCEGFTLDEKKYAAGVSQLVTGGDKLSEEEQLQRLTAVMFNLGTAHGLFLAEGALKKDAFCAEAAEQKADKDHSHSWQ